RSVVTRELAERRLGLAENCCREDVAGVGRDSRRRRRNGAIRRRATVSCCRKITCPTTKVRPELLAHKFEKGLHPATAPGRGRCVEPLAKLADNRVPPARAAQNFREGGSPLDERRTLTGFALAQHCPQGSTVGWRRQSENFLE